MESDLVRIFRIDSGPTKTPGLTVFVITTTKVARPDCCLQLETVNPYAASLCQRAYDQGRAIIVEHERTKYGDTLRGAYFPKAMEVA